MRGPAGGRDDVHSACFLILIGAGGVGLLVVPIFCPGIDDANGCRSCGEGASKSSSSAPGGEGDP